MSETVFILGRKNDGTRNVAVTIYKNHVWAAPVIVSPNDGKIYSSGIDNGGGLLVDQNGLCHVFFGSQPNINAIPDTFYHVAIDQNGNLGPVHTFSDMTTGSAFAVFPILFQNRIIIPYINASGQPALWRGTIESNPTWTTELVSSEIYPFDPVSNLTQPCVAGVGSTLQYFYVFNDFATRCQLMRVLNSGSGWGAPSVYYDALLKPPPNPFIPAIQNIQDVGARLLGGLSVAYDVFSNDAPGHGEITGVFTPSTPAGLFTGVEIPVFAPQAVYQAPIPFGGKWFQFQMNQSAAPFQVIRAWRSPDGNVWTDAGGSFQTRGEHANTYPGGSRFWFTYFAFNGGNLSLTFFDMATGSFVLEDGNGPSNGPGNLDIIDLMGIFTPAAYLTLAFKGQKVYPL